MISVKEINNLLPQSQCGKCSYSGCLSYARALKRGTTKDIGRCFFGGIELVKKLGKLLNIDVNLYLKDIDKYHKNVFIAKIDVFECIGCSKCIKYCPVDAIIGSRKLMHAVIPYECTGCGLCIEICPMNCIQLVPSLKKIYDKEKSYKRFILKKKRLLKSRIKNKDLFCSKEILNNGCNKNLDQEKKLMQDYIKNISSGLK
ncbi:RnfABCDGE type electron transport complex subunit B [Candidatus Legionella polyplacis]|uniref:RnfABCDGE type electron transport complex subunit B n=1 Tax=Candidatus Legionella polyplacis TaxID=2005262 RepID=A0ABZ2H0Z1_9GAMM